MAYGGRGKRFCTLYLLTCGLLFITFRYVPPTEKNEKDNSNPRINFTRSLWSAPLFDVGREKPSKDQTPKIIIRWTGGSAAPEPNRTVNCHNYKCIITTDRSLLNKSRAVLFDTFMLSDYVNDLPKTRHPWQDWALLTREPPYEIRALEKYRNKFNIIIHHRRDADVTTSYGYFVRMPQIDSLKRSKELTRNYAENKTGMVAWIVSNCKPPSKRHLYVEELQKHIQVDIYGVCNGNVLGGHRHDNGETYLNKIKEYKFYLAFENQLCSDYITEKLWNSLRVGTIPVVLGGANYNEFLVKGSYIDVKDFDSPKSLANRLLYLNSNDEEYDRYFQWRRTHTIEANFNAYCHLCKHLHVHDKPVKVYSDPKSWFAKCTDPKEYYKGVANMIIPKL